MDTVRVAIAVLATLMGCWLTYDGTRALTQGDYTTPQSGPYAGRLGPWSSLVSAVGLNPRSVTIKALHVSLGLFWLLGALAFIAKPHLGRPTLVVLSVCTLWYLPFGTVLAVIELTLLFLSRIRN